MDRNTIIGIALALVLFMAYMFYNQKKAQDAQALAQKEQEQFKADSIANYQKTAVLDTLAQTKAATDTSAKPLVMDSTTANQLQQVEAAKLGPFHQAYNKPSEVLSLENNLLKVDFSTKGAEPIQIRLKNYKTYSGDSLYILKEGNGKFNFTYPLLGGYVLNTEDVVFDVEKVSDNSLSFKLKTADGGFIEHLYTLKPDSNFLDFSIVYNNLSSVMGQNASSVELNWNQNILPQEHQVKFERRYSSLYYKFSNGDVEHLNQNKDDEEEVTGIQWVGYKQQFFNLTLLSANKMDAKVKVTVDNKNDAVVKSYSSKLYVEKNSDHLDFRFFAGANNFTRLSSLDNKMEKMVQIGPDFVLTRWFRYITRFAIIPTFNFLSRFISNYGIIIFILALMVKIVLTPLTYKSYKYSATMQLLKPEMDELKAKYGDDQQRLSSETMKLQSKAGVSPLSGCLPMLFQMPILISMYYFFPSSIELRQASFLWAPDLSTYDAIVSFPPLLFGLNHISLFSVLMALASIGMTLTNPQMTGGAGGMDNPMLKYMPYVMPVFLFFIFNDFPAALTYYYFLFNLFSIAHQYIIKKFFIDEDKLHKEIQMRKSKPAKKGGWMQKLEELQKQQQQQAKAATKRK